MPFYDYICEACEGVCEKFHGMNEDPGTCPQCGGKVQRLPGSITVIRDPNVGNIVKEFIEENKQLTKAEKERLSKQEFKK